ncbi:TM2 domain-containing protein [Brackiella oedipodis]|uniref:TM2 domain-containing protein n=1 Tax=Brackiella oedipodis TaxID=124225 RepID=UPI000490CD1C|nr:TM2 domain-containing protein [Brackiella oedipodis]
MLQKIILAIVIFIVVMLGLNLGQDSFSALWQWIQDLFGVVIHNVDDLRRYLEFYVVNHTWQIIIAIILTIIICLWLFKFKGQSLRDSSKQRKIAAVLAFFLGWLGLHRFYLGQIAKGCLYVLLFMFIQPLAVLLGIIDGIRYLCMSDEDFDRRFKL